jgi:hypothetical protein
MPVSSADMQKADAVLQLARSLFNYGQHERVLSLLDLHDWIVTDIEESTMLRMQVLIKLQKFADAKLLCTLSKIEFPRNLLAEINWGLGQKEAGDSFFRK